MRFKYAEPIAKVAVWPAGVMALIAIFGSGAPLAGLMSKDHFERKLARNDLMRNGAKIVSAVNLIAVGYPEEEVLLKSGGEVVESLVELGGVGRYVLLASGSLLAFDAVARLKGKQKPWSPLLPKVQARANVAGGPGGEWNKVITYTELFIGAAAMLTAIVAISERS